MLTKQLQVLIDVSLSSGRSFDDIRTILKLQGFSDETIDGLFEAYRSRGPVKQGMSAAAPQQAPAAAPPQAPPTPPAQPSIAPPDATPTKTYEAPVIMPHHSAPAAASSASVPQTAAVSNATPVPPVSAPGMPTGQAQPMRIDVAPDFMPSQMHHETVDPTTYASGVDVLNAPRPVSTAPVAGSINVGIAGVPELERAALEEYQRKIDKSPVPMIIMLVVVLALIGGFAYWFFTTGPGAYQAPEGVSITDVQNATPTIEEIVPLSNGTIDPFTGAPRLPDTATITPVVVPQLPTMDDVSCGPFKRDLALDDSGQEVTDVQRYFGDIGLFTIFAEQAKTTGTFTSFNITPGTYDQQMVAAVRFYQSVMFDGERALSNVAPGVLDQPTREVMFDDCNGEKFQRYYRDVVNTGRDVQIKAVLGSIRIDVFGYFDSAATFDGLCTKSSNVASALDRLGLLTSELGGPVCRSTNSDWIIAAPLYSSTGLWCIDSFKNSLEVQSISSTQLKCR